MISLLQDPGASFTPGALSYSATTTDSTAKLKHHLFQKRDGSYWLVLYNDLATSTDTDKTAPVTLAFGQAMDLQVYGVDSTTALNNYTNVTSTSLSVPDKVMIVKITPTTAAGGGDTGGGTTDPVEEPTPTPTTTIHVGDIDAQKREHRSRGWRATFTTRIENADHKAIANATVYYTLKEDSPNGTSSVSASCITNTSGVCSYTPSWDKKATSMTFTVTKVVHPSISYDAAKNHDPDGDSNGTTITATK